MEEVPLDTEKPQRELSWWPSGSDSMLPMQGAWVSSLVGELRSDMPHNTAKEKEKKKRKNSWILKSPRFGFKP